MCEQLPACLLQCCPDLQHPQHGYRGLGCCAATEHGCCPDLTTPATGPHNQVGELSILT